MPRIIDVLLSLLALLVLLPLFIPIVIILLLTGEHKVFYLQTRVGYKNKNFKIIKFATMLSNSANMGSGSLTLRNDPRVLPFGTFLRKTKINELPQILNIIIGDLSIVGPRPQMQVDFVKYSQEVQKKIYNVRPGLTGIGSIVFRNEEAIFENVSDPCLWDEKVIMPYKGKLERWYSDNMSLNMYIKLIMLTSITLAFPRQENYQKWFKSLPLPEENLNHKIREYL